jgi:hypothetical protein
MPSRDTEAQVDIEYIPLSYPEVWVNAMNAAISGLLAADGNENPGDRLSHREVTQRAGQLADLALDEYKKRERDLMRSAPARKSGNMMNDH